MNRCSTILTLWGRMQWCVEIPCSSFSLSILFPNNNTNRLSSSILILICILNIMNLPLSVHTLTISACSPYLFSTSIDIRTKNQYVQPCPISTPCQCICEIESKRLWIDCFNRKLEALPIFENISTDNLWIRISSCSSSCTQRFEARKHSSHVCWVNQNSRFRLRQEANWIR